MDYIEISGLKVKKSGADNKGNGVRTIIVETLLALPQGGAFPMIDLRMEVLRRFKGREITNPKQQSYVRINNTLHDSKKLAHFTKCENSNGYTFLVNGDAETLINNRKLKLYDLSYVEGKPVFTKVKEEPISRQTEEELIKDTADLHAQELQDNEEEKEAALFAQGQQKNEDAVDNSRD